MPTAHEPTDTPSTEAWKRREEYIKRFEAAWLAGQRPPIDDYLPADAADRRAVLVELVHTDMECRLKAGEKVAVENYLLRYCDLADDPEIRRDLIAAANELRQEAPGGTRGTTENTIGSEWAPRQGAPHIPGYEILGELGRGGMGVVYKARQVALNRVVALKMILAGSHAGSAEVARFKQEAEAVARLQHPNIVQIHEIGDAEGKPFFSLEYVAGGSLAQKINGMPQPARQAAQLVETLARAMHAAHERGIVHRDLKPGNILLDCRLPIADCRLKEEEIGQPFAIGNRQSAIGNPKITDFGLAKQLDTEKGQTQSGAILGTPSYMAPEQAGGKSKDISPAADVYALGAILYELLTGRPPFKAETPLDTLFQVMSEDPVPPTLLQAKVPTDLETVCLKCLEKQRGKRYHSALLLAEDLDRFLQGRPLSIRSQSRWALSTFAHRWPLLSFVLVVLLFGVCSSLWDILVTVLYFVPRLNEAQRDAYYYEVVPLYNIVAYPGILALGIWVLQPLVGCRRDLAAGVALTRQRLTAAQRRVVALPLLATSLVILGWLPLPMFFPMYIGLAGGWENAAAIWWHFSLSFAMGVLAAVQTYFLLEHFVLRVLCPIFFQGAASEAAGPIPLAWLRVAFWVSTTAMPVLPVLLVALQGMATQSTDLAQFQLLYTLFGLAFSALTFWVVGHDWRYRLGGM